eukprot:6606019-Prymnesium_polylepis.1
MWLWRGVWQIQPDPKGRRARTTKRPSTCPPSRNATSYGVTHAVTSRIIMMDMSHCWMNGDVRGSKTLLCATAAASAWA